MTINTIKELVNSSLDSAFAEPSISDKAITDIAVNARYSKQGTVTVTSVFTLKKGEVIHG